MVPPQPWTVTVGVLALRSVVEDEVVDVDLTQRIHGPNVAAGDDPATVRGAESGGSGRPARRGPVHSAWWRVSDKLT
ncbi:hypothetical protein GCM10027057_25690 [Marisediminicola antarctica]